MKSKIVSRETKKLSIILLVIFIFTNISTFTVQASDLYLEADTFAIADKNTGLIYDGDSIDEVHGIASLTKLMSAYVIFDKIDGDKIDLNTKIAVTERAYGLSQNPDLSGVYFGLGDEYTLSLMLNLMLVYSDNGATTSIAEGLFGSEEAMVEQMNAKAKVLGLNSTTFYNVTGLTMSDYGDYQLEGSSPTDYNVSTAREMLNLTHSLIEVHPEIMDYVSKSYVEFNGYKLPSYNLMLPGLLMSYDGVQGMKTGNSIEAGYCFVGYYVNPDTQREYLSVVLGADSIPDRFNETAYMYNYVDQLEYKEVKAKDNPQSVTIRGSKSGEDIIIPRYDYYLEDEFTVNAIKTKIDYNDKYFDEDDELISDIPAGEVVMTYEFQFLNEDEEQIQFFQTSNDNVLSIDYVNEYPIEKENIVQETGRSFVDYIKDCYKNIEI